MNLPTSKFKKIRGDLIEVYKILNNKDGSSSCNLSLHENLHTRGNKYKLYMKQVNYDLRKYFFSNRIIAVWNSLPDHVVASVSINMFKNRLDKFLHAQDLYYNWEANLSGTGDRSYSFESSYQ